MSRQLVVQLQLSGVTLLGVLGLGKHIHPTSIGIVLGLAVHLVDTGRHA